MAEPYDESEYRAPNGHFGTTLVVMIVVGLIAAALFITLYRIDRSPRAAGAADIGGDAVAHLSHRR